MRQPGKTTSSHGFTLALFAIVVLAALLLMVIGSNTYRQTVDALNTADDERAVFSYIATRIHAADAADAVSRGDGPEGPALVLSEDAGGTIFETRIYLYGGSLVEEYAKAGTAYAPDSAQAIAALSAFDFSVDGNMVEIDANGVRHVVSLRSVQGGADGR